MHYNQINKKIKNKDNFTKLLKKDFYTTRLVTFLNPFSYKIFLENKNLIEHFDEFYADGALLVKLHNLFNKNKIDRVSFDFSSIAKDVLEYANKNDIYLSFIGAKQEELTVALQNIQKMYSNIKISYARHGYFNDENDYSECFTDIRKVKVDILIIGMGSPYQENFAIKVKNENLDIPLVFTCGGFLTQTSIKADYYHPIVKKFGLRWLQRAVMHKHVRDRLIKDYPIFVLKYIWNHLKIKFRKG